jgi:hypothetical protein
MPTRQQQAASIDAEIIAGSYHSPTTPATRMLAATLAAAGILTTGGDYTSGDGAAQVETATITGIIANDGTVNITMTAAGMSNSPTSLL